MKSILLATILFTGSFGASAQIYNTISGTVWSEADGTPNGIRDAGEALVTGVLASLIDVNTGLVVASAISNTSGVFTLNNYIGTGDFRIDYSFPGEGYSITDLRSGSDNELNNAADPNAVFNNEVSTLDFTISSNTNFATYGLGLVRKTNTITYYTSKASSPTDWSQTFTLPKSDNNTYGVTNRVVIFATNASFYPMLGIENTSTSEGSSTASIASNGAVKFTLPTVPALQIDANTPTKFANLSVYDGITDYGGTSGASFLFEAGSGTASRLYTSVADLNNYFRSSGPATFNTPTSVTRTSTFSGGGNLQAVSEANTGAGLFVTYRYPTVVILPITLVYFTARKNTETVLVQWKVGVQQSKTDFKNIDKDKWTAELFRALPQDKAQEVYYRIISAPSSNEVFDYVLTLNLIDDKRELIKSLEQYYFNDFKKLLQQFESGNFDEKIISGSEFDNFNSVSSDKFQKRLLEVFGFDNWRP